MGPGLFSPGNSRCLEFGHMFISKLLGGPKSNGVTTEILVTPPTCFGSCTIVEDESYYGYCDFELVGITGNGLIDEVGITGTMKKRRQLTFGHGRAGGAGVERQPLRPAPSLIMTSHPLTSRLREG